MSTSTTSPWEALDSLLGSQIDRLFQSPDAALIVFRKKLSELAQSIVMTMLHIPRPIAIPDLEMFVSPGSTRAYNQALSTLEQCHMLKQIKLGGVESCFLAHDFARSLKQALALEKSKRSCSEAMLLPTIQPVETTELDKYAAQNVDRLINFCIGPLSSSKSDHPLHPELPPNVIGVLENSHIVAFSGSQRTFQQVKLSGVGFTFVTAGLDVQLWTLIFQYVRTARTKQFDEAQAFSFICLVLSLEPGFAFSTISLDKEQLNILEFLASLGIVLLNQRKNSTSISSYVPTRLAAILASRLDSKSITPENSTSFWLSSSNVSAKGFIIVDAGFCVTAYPSQPAQASLLSLFVNINSYDSNTLSGNIDRVSVLRAIEQGISAEQIIVYLNTHAHSKMRAVARQQPTTKGIRATALPAVVAEQIRAWELQWHDATATAELLVKDLESHLGCETSTRSNAGPAKAEVVISPIDSHLKGRVRILRSA